MCNYIADCFDESMYVIACRMCSLTDCSEKSYKDVAE